MSSTSSLDSSKDHARSENFHDVILPAVVQALRNTADNLQFSPGAHEVTFTKGVSCQDTAISALGAGQFEIRLICSVSDARPSNTEVVHTTREGEVVTATIKRGSARGRGVGAQHPSDRADPTRDVT